MKAITEVKIDLAIDVAKVTAGALLVYHGWSGTPANFYPFIFGLWILLDTRLSWVQEAER